MLETITRLKSCQRAVADAKRDLKTLIEKLGQPESVDYREIHILIDRPWKIKGSMVELMSSDGESYEELDAIVNSYVSDENVVVFDVYDCCMSSMDGNSAYLVLSKANQIGEISDSIICRTR